MIQSNNKKASDVDCQSKKQSSEILNETSNILLPKSLVIATASSAEDVLTGICTKEITDPLTSQDNKENKCEDLYKLTGSSTNATDEIGIFLCFEV